MGGLTTRLPILWAQAPAPGIPATPGGATSLAPLALRRWCASLTLSSPEAVPSLFSLGAWLAGLGVLLLLALAAQGPARALGQLFDLPGHLCLIGEAAGRLRRSGRMVAVVVGMTVVAWTATQTATHSREQGRADLQLLTKARSLSELSLEQGVMAGLTALRDVFGLSNNLLLLVIAAVLVFRISAERWANPVSHPRDGRGERTAWGHSVWLGSAFYIVYRLVALGADAGDLPPGGCLMIEALIIPPLMVLADGFLLAWVLVELRSASLGEAGNDVLDPNQAIGLMPGAALACLVALPARYVATGVLLASLHLPSSVAATPLGGYMRWQLSWGLTELQAAALPLLGLAGAVAWSRGTLGGAVRGYFRLLKAEGGHLLAALILAGVAGGSLAGLAYLLVLSLPPQPWVLMAADGYAHYATLPVGLLALAAIVELGERSLPLAALADGEGEAEEPSRLADGG